MSAELETLPSSPFLFHITRSYLNMPGDNQGQRELVYCHACEDEWYRDESGLTCPGCGSDVVEIVGTTPQSIQVIATNYALRSSLIQTLANITTFLTSRLPSSILYRIITPGVRIHLIPMKAISLQCAGQGPVVQPSCGLLCDLQALSGREELPWIHLVPC